MSSLTKRKAITEPTAVPLPPAKKHRKDPECDSIDASDAMDVSAAPSVSAPAPPAPVLHKSVLFLGMPRKLTVNAIMGIYRGEDDTCKRVLERIKQLIADLTLEGLHESALNHLFTALGHLDIKNRTTLFNLNALTLEAYTDLLSFTKLTDWDFGSGELIADANVTWTRVYTIMTFKASKPSEDVEDDE